MHVCKYAKQYRGFTTPSREKYEDWRIFLQRAIFIYLTFKVYICVRRFERVFVCI